MCRPLQCARSALRRRRSPMPKTLLSLVARHSRTFPARPYALGIDMTHRCPRADFLTGRYGGACIPDPTPGRRCCVRNGGSAAAARLRSQQGPLRWGLQPHHPTSLSRAPTLLRNCVPLLPDATGMLSAEAQCAWRLVLPSMNAWRPTAVRSPRQLHMWPLSLRAAGSRVTFGTIPGMDRSAGRSCHVPC